MRTCNHNTHHRMRRRMLVAAMGLALSGTLTSVSAQQLDPVTGATWALFDNPAEGLQQGFRAATVDEFKGLLAHANWVQRTDGSLAYDYIAPPGSTVLQGSHSEINRPNLAFPGLRVAQQQVVQPASAYFANAGWLLAADGSASMGLIERRQQGGTTCGGRGGCSSFTHYTSAAEIATADELTTKFAAGQFPSYFLQDTQPGALGTRFDPLSSYRNADGSFTAGTFMISSVPEPSGLLAGLLGVAGIALAVRRVGPAGRR